MAHENATATADELTTAGEESTDPAYLAWKRSKIEAAIADADARPDDFLTLDEAWKRHRLAD